MTRGHESEKAAAEPLSARALVRIWRRIAGGICLILGVESASIPACDDNASNES